MCVRVCFRVCVYAPCPLGQSWSREWELMNTFRFTSHVPRTTGYQKLCQAHLHPEFTPITLRGVHSFYFRFVHQEREASRLVSCLTSHCRTSQLEIPPCASPRPTSTLHWRDPALAPRLSLAPPTQGCIFFILVVLACMWLRA